MADGFGGFDILDLHVLFAFDLIRVTFVRFVFDAKRVCTPGEEGYAGKRPWLMAVLCCSGEEK